jgi:hypothetical protein
MLAGAKKKNLRIQGIAIYLFLVHLALAAPVCFSYIDIKRQSFCLFYKQP